MIKISFPQECVRVRKENGTAYVFDELRKKWLVLTPEEWVRQHFVQYLLRVMEYPPALIAVEKEIKLGEMRKRFDIVVFDRGMQPWMIVECKEMGVSLGERTLDQILAYHMALPCRHLVITNGSYTYGFEIRENQFFEMAVLPAFPVLT